MYIFVTCTSLSIADVACFGPLSSLISTPFYLGHEKLPGPLPPLPAWMLDTPMYSKLPMVPAPKGRIVLATTGLCKKVSSRLIFTKRQKQI